MSTGRRGNIALERGLINCRKCSAAGPMHIVGMRNLPDGIIQDRMNSLIEHHLLGYTTYASDR